MANLHTNKGWLATVALLTALGLGSWSVGTSLAQKSANPPEKVEAVTPPGLSPVKENVAVVKEGVSVAKELSTAFRAVSKEALRGIVSIETVTKAVPVQGRGRGREMLGEDSPLRDFFKQNPNFEEMFKNAPQQSPQSHGMGSGFIIDSKGLVLTNNHVVQGAEQVKIRLQDGREFIANDVKTDPKSDVAVVKFDAPNDLHALKIGNSDEVEIGDWVLAVGSPFGLDFSVTSGIISAKGRGVGITEREDFLQTDAAINPGNSGGPLLNLDGEVIGINTAISSRSGGFDGVGFAIPINMANWIGQQLVEKGAVSRGFLGIGIQGVTNSLSEKFHTPVNQGVIVSQVLADSPAAKAGLETGDVILSLNKRAIRTPRDLQGTVERLKIGDSYPLEVMRSGKKMDLSIAIQEMPSDYAVADRDEKPQPEAAKPETKAHEGLGIEVQAATPEVVKELGYNKSVTGVVVSGVSDKSPAGEAGLKAGMVIEKVGDKKVTTPEEFVAATKDWKGDDTVLFLVQTPRGSQFVVVGGK